MQLLPVSSPFRFRLDRRDSSALVESWIVISQKVNDDEYVRVAGPFTLKRYSITVEHTPMITLNPGTYRCKVEVTVTEAKTLAGLFDFRLSIKDGTQDQRLYDEASQESIDTTEGIDVVAGADTFELVVA